MLTNTFFSNSIRKFMLITALLGAALLFIGAYAVVANVYDRTVRSDAREVSEILAGQTFDAMFQVMRKGWKRPDVEQFIEAMRKRFAATPYMLEIYRGPVVEALFGAIEQPPIDAEIKMVFAEGSDRVLEQESALRHLYPLRARQECLACHVNAQIGTVLGVIDLRQDLTPLLARARSNFVSTLWLVVPMMLIGAFAVAWIIQERINRSVQLLRNQVSRINKVSDLAKFSPQTEQVGFRELDDILLEVKALTERLRTFAVDKELLEFEIRLLERFIITSDVVRDWREYVSRLLIEVNGVMETYILLSVFKVEEELFDLEIFWRNQPSLHMMETLEKDARELLLKHPHFKEEATLQIHHNIADRSKKLPDMLDGSIVLRSKNLFVETPKIGGIVGIGLQAGQDTDPMKMLVSESILSTLLNVVGSVKAIYKYTKELEHYATRDPLTNLFNQRVFWDLFDYELDRAKRKEERLGLLVIDVDNFKTINDTYGHIVGDAYLQNLADLLRKTFRMGDLIARYGGDEFVALLTDSPENQVFSAAKRMATEVQKLGVTAPDGKQIRTTLSVGIALYPDHGEAARDLFLVADNMMYRAKSEGKNRTLLAGEGEVIKIYRDMGEQNFAILGALEEHRFVPYFQPIVSVADGGICGYEVLSRMVDEQGQIIAASQFIETAERTGVVQQIDYQVMDAAFAHMYSHDQLMFINLSPKALVLSEFMPKVKRMVAKHKIDPERVVFELTERETVRNISLLQRFVGDLKMEGYCFAIDDFGSGFSSFRYLKHFPIDFLKIDGDFIVNLLHDERDQVFVRHMSDISHELGIRTIAEFVEDDEVLQKVREAGIDLAQGYVIGHPQATAGPSAESQTADGCRSKSKIKPVLIN
jgi:diguanylate cyclase (GGDEF)-like protein